MNMWEAFEQIRQGSYGWALAGFAVAMFCLFMALGSLARER
jgi:hypothetical protein